MDSSGRSRPSAISNRQSRGPTALPPYETPAHPLNREAQNALHDMPRNHKLDTLKARMKAANNHLTQAAADINDRLHAKMEIYERGRKRREAMSSQGSNAVDIGELEQMQKNTNEMTQALDQKVRDVIDARAEVENVERALRELDANAAANRGILAPTQSTLGASQFRGHKRRRRGPESGEEEQGEESDNNQPAMEGDGAVELLKGKIAEYRKAYQAESMAERYASHNDYIGFKKIVHDARYPGDKAPPLPHASTWFASGSQETQRSSADGAAGSQAVEDDDFEVASERISIKCPITLLPMRDPVSSTKCVHNFEKEAILSMINSSDVRAGGDGRRGAGQKAMKCPVCEVLLTANDLESNPVLIRKIKRNQAAENAQDEESDDDESNNRPPSNSSQHEEVSSSPPPTISAIKRERMSQAASANAARDVSMVPSTQI
ncbi:MAG: hypothetical protein Q9217_003568 [Psora testacea]